MKDAKHHLKHVQRKVIQSIRKEEYKKAALNGQEKESTRVVSTPEQNFIQRRF